MRKIVAFACALALLVAALPALAEDALPQAVETFFAYLEEEMGGELQVAYAQGLEAYVLGMPGGLYSYTLSREQYEDFYFVILDDTTALTVCCIGGKPAAYIFDFKAIDYIGGLEKIHLLIEAIPDAYCAANPQQQSSMDGYGFITCEMIGSIYDSSEGVFFSEVQDHGETVASSHIFALGGQIAMQLFPKDAYQGATYQGKELTAEGNHELSAQLAIMAEYYLVQDWLSRQGQ